jgi:uncharacterized protein with PQ loop repeat
MSSAGGIHSKKDRLSAATFVIFGIAMLVWIIPVGIPVAFVPPRQIGPQFLPVVLSAAIAVVAALILVIPVFKQIRGRLRHEQISIAEDRLGVPADHSPGKGAENGFLRFAPWLTITIVALYFLLLLRVGFIVSSAFAIVATMLVFGDRRWWAIAILSLAVPLLMWAFAMKLLHIPMP